ncbi:Tox-REase-5 domain-containing protein [Flavisolibacter tropicus]|uniref:Fibronectin type-III domain-containing protein n=1 Tax=Flavisolibacter tropicus TaxID=1492898 RepID=A0A172U0E8_9BACT|nr:Tox-REase-5 domain-containing protein [Flavisolibacter tropicus]ANE52825.1 hypothetical protein SY85_22460 [Flavisolibacter tropicus]
MQSVHTIYRKTRSISRKRLVARFLNLVLFNLFLSFFTSSQTIHPVTTAVQLVPPYSVYLPDYAASGTDKLRVILTLNDITQSSYQVKLAIKVELNGRLILQTDPAFQPQPIVLMPWQPVIISGAILSDYLSTANLQFAGGFSRENYERTKALPEGTYKISFTAYDYNRQVPVSNEGYNVFFFKKSEPPVLNLPFHKSRVESKQPQFMTFSWSDRNTPALQSGAWNRPSYRFELFEVRPAGSNPEYIVRSSKPLFSTTTDAATLIYGPAEPLLQDSMEYVWRVQAIDREGREAYSNGGYSQAYLFTYGGQDPFMLNNIGRPVLNGEALGERSGHWNWKVSNQSKVEGWKIQYRKSAANGQQSITDAEQWTWNTEETSDTVFSLFNLEGDHTYEARVQARVKGIYGPWSDIAKFHTSPKRVFECGQQYDQQPLDNAQPLQVATAGMIIRVGDFDMQLLKVEGSSGFFSGYGAITTPLLGFQVNVKFTGIGINDKLVMTSGEVVALSEPMEEWVNERLEVQKDVQVIKGWGETMPDFEAASLEALQDFVQELLGIEDGIWNDTYVYSEKERAEVKGYIGEVKAAVQELSDSDSSNDGAAATKLRKTLQAAKPLLQKLSDNIGKGVLVRLGLIRDELYTTLIEEHIQILEQATTETVQESASHDKGPNINLYDWITGNPTCWDNYPQDKKLAILAFLKKHRKDKSLFEDFKQALDAAIRQEEAIHKSIEELEKYVEEWRKDHPGEQKKVSDIVGNLQAWIGVNRDYFCGIITTLWQRAQLAGKFADEHTPVIHKISSIAAAKLWNNELSQWLSQHAISAKVYLHKVAGSDVDIRQAAGSKTVGKDDAAKEFDEGAFSQNVALWIEHNEQTGEMEVYLKFRNGYLQPPQFAKGRSGDWFAQKIIDRINKKLARSNWDQPILRKQELAGDIDGRYRSEEMDVLQWAVFGMEELGYVVNKAEINPHLWNDIDDKAAYSKSVLNVWAPIAAGGDQGLQEVKDLYELVDFAGEVIENPSVVKDIYNSVTSLSYEDIKGMVQKAYEEKKAQYEKGGTVMQYHTTRDGIQAVMIVAAAAKNLPGIIKKGGNVLQNLKQLLKEIPHADVKAKIRNLDQLLAQKFMEAFEGVDNKLKELLKANPKVFDAWERVAKADVEGLELKVKKFPVNSKRPDVYNAAKEYQKKFSGDADLSFDLDGVSFDDFKDGVLLDAKFGYGKSVFIKSIDDFEEYSIEVINKSLADKLIEQARRQLLVASKKGLKVEWRVSNRLAENGITELFTKEALNNPLFKNIKIVFEKP